MIMRNPQNLHLHELIGLEAQVSKSSCKKWIGIKGKVVDETKNLLVLECLEKEVRIPKSSCVFQFLLDGRKVELEGKRIAFRPQERTKKAL